jgi:hypothetical protein
MRLPPNLPNVAYPALLWWPNYIYLAKNPLQLCDTARSGYKESLEIARSGKARLFAADGRYYHIVDYVVAKPFGNLMETALRLLFFELVTVPVLENERQLALDEFKDKLARAVRDRYRYDADKIDGRSGVKAITEAQTYIEALEAIPGFPDHRPPA